MSVHIRDAEVKDARAIASIHIRSWRSVYKGLYDEEKLATLNVDDRTYKWQQILGKDDSSQTFVAELDGKIIAFATVGEARHDGYEDYAEIYVIHADPDYYGQGTGTKLLEHCKKEAKKMGFKKLMIISEAKNKIGTSFYEKNGGKIDGVIERKNVMGFDAELAYYIWEKI